VRVMTAYEILVEGVQVGVPVVELVSRIRDLGLHLEHVSAMTEALGSLAAMPPSVYAGVARGVAERYRLRD